MKSRARIFLFILNSQNIALVRSDLFQFRNNTYEKKKSTTPRCNRADVAGIKKREFHGGGIYIYALYLYEKGLRARVELLRLNPVTSS